MKCLFARPHARTHTGARTLAPVRTPVRTFSRTPVRPYVCPRVRAHARTLKRTRSCRSKCGVTMLCVPKPIILLDATCPVCRCRLFTALDNAVLVPEPGSPCVRINSSELLLTGTRAPTHMHARTHARTHACPHVRAPAPPPARLPVRAQPDANTQTRTRKL